MEAFKKGRVGYTYTKKLAFYSIYLFNTIYLKLNVTVITVPSRGFPNSEAAST